MPQEEDPTYKSGCPASIPVHTIEILSEQSGSGTSLSPDSISPYSYRIHTQPTTTQSLQVTASLNKITLSLFQLFHRYISNEILILLGYFAAHGHNSLPTFRGNLSVSSSIVKKLILDSLR